jgi:4-hydroxy-tetrahydrodipicolinate reductase
MSLVGVYAYSPEKVGRDAGELCGLGPTGVEATSDIDEILALGADCVLYTPLLCDFDDVCRVLASGANVVTTRGEFLHAGSLDAQTRERIEEACAKGNSSIHSTGSSPGFITEAIPLALTSIQRRLDALTIDEFADLSQRNSPDLLFGVMGFGQPPSAYDERRLATLRGSFGPSLTMLAEALGLPLDELTVQGEVATAPREIEIAAGTLPVGSVAAQRVTVSGIRDGKAVLRFRANWYCSTEIEEDWELRGNGWRVRVEGDAPLHVDLVFPVPMERMAEMSPGYTANRAVNAVPAVCAAAPGIRSTVDLPHIVAALG